MIGALGLTVSVVAAGSASVGVVLAVGAAQGRWSVDRARRAAWCAFTALAAANLLMVLGLVIRDFSIAYVAEVGSRETPLLYTVASLWGALDGSILFWAGLLAGLTVVFFERRPALERDQWSAALAVLLGLVAFFALIVVGPGNPWHRVSPVPVDGSGPNPLLQNHPLMAVHPPLLYLGFVGLAVPFAITVAALVRGRLDAEWLQLSRDWTLGPWISLSLGLLTGAWWSYAVLGWGGYWAWDPVENVALLPWLTSTAFLHSAMVGRRGGMLLTWNVVLVVASFALTLFATLVTRSGVLDSVHAFTRSGIGFLFVGLLGAVLVGSIGLLAVRLPDSTDVGRLGTRGRAFLLNNLLLVSLAGAVLFGTVFPLVAEAVAGTRVSVGAPYFERIAGPLAVGLLVLVGTGPSLPWGEWSATSRAALLPGALAGALVAAVLALSGAGAAEIVGAAAAVFALVQALTVLVRRVARGSGRTARPSLPQPRAIGGLVSHAGFGILALAVLASSAGKREALVSLAPGASAEVLERSVLYRGSQERPGPNRSIVIADVAVADQNGSVSLEPALSVFRPSTQAIATPAILPGVTTDLYVTLLDLDPATDVATIRVGTHPFVSWIWISGLLIAFGAALALVPALSRRPVVARADASGAGLRSGEATVDVA